MSDDIQKIDNNQGQNAQNVHGNQIFNRYTLTNPKTQKFPKIKEPIKIAVINELFYNFTLFNYIFFFIICFSFMPITIYSHMYNIQNMFTMTSSEHQIGYLLLYFYYGFFSFIIIFIIIFPFFSKLSVQYYKKPILTNNSFSKIKFSNIRKLTMSHNILRNKLYLYQIDKPKPIVFMINSIDDMLLINDVFEGYIYHHSNTNNSSQNKLAGLFG
ncbi:MAG: hypothetical protein L3J43_08525 [Sulfurovum sp.]|nr:hypothetical protein [Sulfurovum sp.]